MQPVYEPRPDDLDRKLKGLFPDTNRREEARVLLHTFRTEDQHRDSDRVRLAILYLAGGDVDQVARYAELAQQDYRDVIAAAEYPSFLRLPSHVEPGSEEYWTAVEADAKQYRAWVAS